MIRAGIVVTGTEVITGRISDSNGPWVSERLAERGVEVAHIHVVADRPGDLEATLRFMAAEGMDLIVTTGGLGPTADDLTAEVVGRFAGREMVLDEGMEAKIAEILSGFAQRFKLDTEALMEANRKQAMVPEGSVALDPVGTAPGLVVPAGERIVVVLPGPPRELQPMWGAAVETEPVRALLDRATPLRAYTMRMFGVPESEIAKSLREMEGDAMVKELTAGRVMAMEQDIPALKKIMPGGKQHPVDRVPSTPPATDLGHAAGPSCPATRLRFRRTLPGRHRYLSHRPATAHGAGAWSPIRVPSQR